MHLKSIDVERESDFSRVTFSGQGGEAVSVRLTAGEGDHIERARAMMIQIATFDTEDYLGRVPDRPVEGAEHHGEAKDSGTARTASTNAEPGTGEDIRFGSGNRGTLEGRESAQEQSRQAGLRQEVGPANVVPVPRSN